MPKLTDKITGKVVAELPYDAAGKQQAEQMVQTNPNLKIDYAPGGQSNAAGRSQTMYPGGGKTGYNVPKYQQGGRTPYATVQIKQENLESQLKSETAVAEGKVAGKVGAKQHIKNVDARNVKSKFDIRRKYANMLEAGTLPEEWKRKPFTNVRGKPKKRHYYQVNPKYVAKRLTKEALRKFKPEQYQQGGRTPYEVVGAKEASLESQLKSEATVAKGSVAGKLGAKYHRKRVDARNKASVQVIKDKWDKVLKELPSNIGSATTEAGRKRSATRMVMRGMKKKELKAFEPELYKKGGKVKKKY